jgi:hypothetical protein
MCKEKLSQQSHFHVEIQMYYVILLTFLTKTYAIHIQNLKEYIFFVILGK